MYNDSKLGLGYNWVNLCHFVGHVNKPFHNSTFTDKFGHLYLNALTKTWVASHLTNNIFIWKHSTLIIHFALFASRNRIYLSQSLSFSNFLHTSNSLLTVSFTSCFPATKKLSHFRGWVRKKYISMYRSQFLIRDSTSPCNAPNFW